MDLFEKNGNCLYILNILKKYTDADHLNSIAEIKRKEIKDFAVSTVEMFGGKTENITAICDNLLLDEVIERFGKDIIISKVNEKQFKITVNVNELGFKFWAMRNLDLVKIIAPDTKELGILSTKEEIYPLIRTTHNDIMIIKDEELLLVE